MVAGGGWEYAEMEVTNAGFFLFHCHMAQHSHDGMTTLFRMGDFIPRPPKDFPTCDHFHPPTTKEAFDELMGPHGEWDFWPFRDHSKSAGHELIHHSGKIQSLD